MMPWLPLSELVASRPGTSGSEKLVDDDRVHLQTLQQLLLGPAAAASQRRTGSAPMVTSTKAVVDPDVESGITKPSDSSTTHGTLVTVDTNIGGEDDSVMGPSISANETHEGKFVLVASFAAM